MSDQPEQPSGQFQPLRPDGTPVQPDVRFGAPAPKRKRNPVVIWLSVVAGVLAIALIVVIGLLVVGPGGTPSAGVSSSVSPSATASGTPAPTETTAETPVGPTRPADCAALFPAGYIDSVTAEGQMALNPSWTDATITTEFIGSNDAVLQDYLATTEDRLNCALVKASGGGDVGIITNVAWIDAERQTAAVARMNEAGFTCSEETGGTMCFTEETGDGATVGERHFLRDGTWVATRWSNTGITGWTQTIVGTLFPS